MRRKTGIQGDYAQLRDEILSRFILRERMIDLVGKLKPHGFIVGILSDQTDMLDKLNARMNFFHGSIMSSTATTWARANGTPACLMISPRF